MITHWRRKSKKLPAEKRSETTPVAAFVLIVVTAVLSLALAPRPEVPTFVGVLLGAVCFVCVLVLIGWSNRQR